MPFTVIYEVELSDGSNQREMRAMRIAHVKNYRDAADNACLHALRLGARTATAHYVVGGNGHCWAVERIVEMGRDGITCTGTLVHDTKLHSIPNLSVREAFWQQLPVAVDAYRLVQQLMAELDIGSKDSLQTGIDRLRERARIAEERVAELEAEKQERIEEAGRCGQ